VASQRLLVGTDQVSLPHGRHGLEGHGVAGPPVTAHAEVGQTGGDGPGGDDEHPVTLAAQCRHLVAELGHEGAVDLALVVGDRRGPDLDDDGPAGGAHESSS
jgi:hypothetical protein